MTSRRNLLGLCFLLVFSFLNTQGRFSTRPPFVLFPNNYNNNWDDWSLAQVASTSKSKPSQYEEEDASATLHFQPKVHVQPETVTTTTSNERDNHHSSAEPAVRNNLTCPPGLELPKLSKISFHQDENGMTNTSASHRIIPRAIHMISKTKCMTKPFLFNLDRWRFVN